MRVASVPTATDSPNSVQVTFDFSASPIPFAASDVRLQVVYRGKLGTERDAVVVATKDISEPSYFALANYTDYVYSGDDDRYHPLPFNALHTQPEVVNDIRVSFVDDGGPIVATLTTLTGGAHAQLAWMSDRGYRPVVLHTTSVFGNYPPRYVHASETWFDQALGLFRHLPCPYYSSRGVYRDYLAFFMVTGATEGGTGWSSALNQPQVRSNGQGMMMGGDGVAPKGMSAEKDAPSGPPPCSDGTGIMDHSTMAQLPSAVSWTINFQ